MKQLTLKFLFKQYLSKLFIVKQLFSMVKRVFVSTHGAEKRGLVTDDRIKRLNILF